ncbi:MAG TPA: N-acetylmuramoyl-L-alanine amidase [Gemmatimonadales bacterium]|nr:N-acetylmuramoyl-L-alanine amidase [Gemmatimonadales bacterium]
MHLARSFGAGWLALATLCCAPQPITSPGPDGASRRLPAVPEVRGPLALRVVYPRPDDTVSVRDSSFIFGYSGNGAAAVTVNRVPARVWPNGAWLAWLAFPRDSLMHFDIEARTAADSARLDYVVPRAMAFEPPAAPVWIDSSSLRPSGRVWLGHGELLTLSARASAGALVQLRLSDGTVVPLWPEGSHDEVPRAVRAFDRDTANLALPLNAEHYAGLLAARPLGQSPGAVLPGAGPDFARALAAARARCPTGRCPFAVAEPLPVGSYAEPVLEAISGGDTARVSWPLSVAVLDTLPVVAELDDDVAHRGGTDSLTPGRTTPGGSYYWFFPTGTRAVVSGRVNDDLRLRLEPGLDTWVAAADAHALPAGTPPPAATVGSVTLSRAADPDRAVVRIPVGERLPFHVTPAERSVTLTLYGAMGDLDWMRYGPVARDSLVRRMSWEEKAPGQVVLTLDLARPLWGYRVRWSRTDLVVELRAPPPMDPSHPLEGRVIVVDPGHPPLGATGPTGLREQDANLAVALRLRDLLRSAGARVTLTRSDSSAVDLLPRIGLAERLNADLLVSIHQNALPDGVNPLTNSGTSVFYNQPQALPLARDIETALVRRLGLRDLGVGRADLALARPSWMPAVLCEGMYIIMPDQEAALRSAEGQELYARGVYDGIERFLRTAAAP